MRISGVLAAAAFMTFGTSASAAVVIDSVEDIGETYTIEFEGQVNGTAEPDITSILDLTFLSANANGSTYSFSYTLENTSTIAARLRSFGFNVDNAKVTGGSATGAYPQARRGDNFPEGVGKLDACFAADGGKKCTGGPNGLLAGQSSSGTFTIALASGTDSLVLSKFTTRYQSVGPDEELSGIGNGTVTQAVPEPGTWLMMILGFAAVGSMMRRRQQEARVRYA